MRAVVVTRHGPPEVLQVQQRPDPQPGRGQVRVAVEAAGLNFADVLARAGLYPDAPRPPVVLGYEVAGTVDAVGPGVDSVQPGDRVIAATRFGGQAELAVAAAVDTIPIPGNMPASEAAAVPVTYATAYAALVLMAGVKAGERVLIHVAAGGVGCAATQLAHHLGALVIGTASAAKHARVRELGAEFVIDYHNQDVVAEVLRFTNGEGVDVILDALGPKFLRADWRLLRPGGRLVAYGATQVQTGERRNLLAAARTVAAFPFATMPWWKGPAMLNENRGIFGLNLKHWWDREGNLSRLILPLRELLQGGVIRPVVDSTFPFDRAADAHRRIIEGRNVGKVLLTPR
jgi:NADPH:quinone reductase-like Zn-dependent oxidoreductase